MLRLMLMGTIFILSAPATAEESGGTATISLEEVLRLHKLADTKPQPEALPPVAFSVSSFDAEATIVGDAIEATAKVSLSVFASGWVEVPILEKDSGLDLTAVPKIENGYLSAKHGALSFLTEKAGDYDFEFSFIKRAVKVRSQWGVSVLPATAGIQRIALKYDADVFEVSASSSHQVGDTMIIFSRQGKLSLAWKSLRGEAKKVIQRRPPVEPVVLSGAASIVVTLDGQRIMRILYKLRFQGSQILVVGMPPDQALTKVYMNGISQPIEESNGEVKIAIAPPRPGEQSATLEVVLKQRNPPMALSGKLAFELPKLSWGINEMQCTLFLPSVFYYDWVGGSLSPAQSSPLPQYTFDIPTPGKNISVKQQLVTSASDTVVEYTVDLNGKYFQ